MIGGINNIANELAGWDFLSILALLMIIFGISTKIPWGNVGFSILVFKILGNDWGVGFLFISLLLECFIHKYENYQRRKVIVCALNDFGILEIKGQVQKIQEECENIRKTINPNNNYFDSFENHL